MSIALNTALANINPEKSRTERLMRDDKRMGEINRDLLLEEQMNQRYNEQIAQERERYNEKIKDLNWQDQEKIIAAHSERRAHIKEQIRKAGSLNAFMRRGGMKMLNKFQDDFVNSPELARARHNARERERLYAFQQKGIPVSRRSLAAWQAYEKGERDSFDVVPLEKVDLSEIQKSYTMAEAINPEDILKQYRPQIITNFQIEKPNMEITQENLMDYVNQTYGGIYGVKPVSYSNPKSTRSSRGSRRTGPTQREIDQNQRNVYTQNTMFISDANAGKDQMTGTPALTVEEGTLGKFMEQQGMFNMGLYQPQNLKSYNKEGLGFNEAYVVNEGTENVKKIVGVAPGVTVNEDGSISFNTQENNVFNQWGIQAGNNEQRGEFDNRNVNGKVRRLMTVKKRDNVYLRGDKSGIARNTLLMTAKDEELQEEMDFEEAQFIEENEGRDAVGAVMVAEVVDEEGKSYYIEVGNNAYQASQIKEIIGESGRVDDEAIESSVSSKKEQTEKHTAFIQNQVNAEDVKSALPLIENFALEQDFSVDANYVAPMVNAYADLLLFNLSEQEGWGPGEIPPGLRRKLIQDEVLPLLSMSIEKDDDLLSAMHNPTGSPMKQINRYMMNQSETLQEYYQYHRKGIK